MTRRATITQRIWMTFGGIGQADDIAQDIDHEVDDEATTQTEMRK